MPPEETRSKSDLKQILVASDDQLLNKIYSYMVLCRGTNSVSHLFIFLPALIYGQEAFSLELITTFVVFCFLSCSLNLLRALDFYSFKIPNGKPMPIPLLAVSDSGIKVLSGILILTSFIISSIFILSVTLLILVYFVNNAFYSVLLNDLMFNKILFLPIGIALKIMIGIELSGLPDTAMWLIFPALIAYLAVTSCISFSQQKMVH